MSLLIKNGTIYNGKDQPPFKADVLIRGNTIVKIGDSIKEKTEKEIDAEECLVLPGFIDINSASDHYLDIISDPYQEKFIKNGITSIIGGNCGSSLAPISKGDLKSVRKWGVDSINELNINWHSFSEFLNTIESRGLGINFGTLLGHHTLRSEIIKKEDKDLTHKDLKLLEKIIEKDSKDGALGVSLGLTYAHSRNIHKSELINIAKIAERNKRILSVHLRDDGHPKNSLEEIFDITKGNSKIQINHLQPLTINSEGYGKILEKIEKESEKKNINFDSNTYPAVILPFYKLLPYWAQIGSLEDMENVLNKNEDKILEHFKTLTSRKIIIAKAPKSFNFYNGKTLKEIAENKKTTKIEALFTIMKETSLRGVCLYHNVDKKLLENYLFSEASLISSNGLNILLPEFNVFTDFIKKANDSKKISLEKAISKVTSIPAKKFGIKNRGVIEENKKGDIVILKNYKVKDVIVNGKISLNKGEFIKGLNGKFIKWES